MVLPPVFETPKPTARFTTVAYVAPNQLLDGNDDMCCKSDDELLVVAWIIHYTNYPYCART